MQIFHISIFYALTMACTSMMMAFDYPCIPSFSEVGLSGFAGFENFRGMADGNVGDNNGAHFGAELVCPLPYLDMYKVGVQLAGSVGAYDFAGRATTYHHKKAIQYQEFLTAGFFIYPSSFCPVGIGIVSDWMFNKNYGIYAQRPTIQQYRAKVSYFMTPNDEMGFWGSYDAKKTHKLYNYGFIKSKLTYRAIGQINLFWRHFFGCGVESTLWIGTPVRNRLNRIQSNRAGKYIVGAELTVPFFDSWAISGKACYMQPGTRKGRVGAREYVSNIAINLIYYMGGNPNIGKSVAWTPYIPIADNSNFFVDVCTKSTNHVGRFKL
ncbi:MAG: hypothetical protein H0T62_01900 [Parachlamydiaceae bacterium]|nr:hypothetical protein [Parachlamydiaceae bacterium]